jgi:hypothetical protein
MRLGSLIIAAVLSLGLAACANGDTAAQNQTRATLKSTAQGDALVGEPAITHFAEKQLLKDVYERRDSNVSTWAYLQGMDGTLKCLGRAVGYGIPYGTQFTAPQALRYLRPVDADGSTGQAEAEMVDQPEPNGLYMPTTADATWIQIVDPSTGKLDVVYVEPHLVVSPFRMHGPIVSIDCADTPSTSTSTATTPATH